MMLISVSSRMNDIEYVYVMLIRYLVNSGYIIIWVGCISVFVYLSSIWMLFLDQCSCCWQSFLIVFGIRIQLSVCGLYMMCQLWYCSFQLMLMFLVSMFEFQQLILVSVVLWNIVIMFDIVKMWLYICCVCLISLMIDENLLICMWLSSDVCVWMCGLLVIVFMFGLVKKCLSIQLIVLCVSSVLLLMYSRYFVFDMVVVVVSLIVLFLLCV